MLITLIALAALLLSGGVQYFSNASSDTATEPISPLLRPEDPSTLTLALIGVGTIAVYLAARRSLRSRGELTSGSGLVSDQSFEVAAEEPVLAQAEEPARGAA